MKVGDLVLARPSGLFSAYRNTLHPVQIITIDDDYYTCYFISFPKNLESSYDVFQRHNLFFFNEITRNTKDINVGNIIYFRVKDRIINNVKVDGDAPYVYVKGIIIQMINHTTFLCMYDTCKNEEEYWETKIVYRAEMFRIKN